MKRSFVSCVVICGVFFIAEFATERATDPSSTLSELVGVVSAQSTVDEKSEDPRPKRKLLPVSSKFFNQIEKITTAIDEEEDFEKAREILDQCLEQSKKWSERELAIFHRRYANVGLLLEDYDLTLEHLKKILEYREFIQYFEEERALWVIASLYATQDEDYDTAIDYFQQWLDLKNDWDEGSRHYAYIGGIYTNMEDYYKTEEWMSRAIAKANEESEEIPETWSVQLLSAFTQIADENEDNPTERDKYLQKALALSEQLVQKYVENEDYKKMLENINAKISSATDDVLDDETDTL